MRSLFFPIALAVLSACTYSKREKRTASIEGKVEASVVRIDRKAIGIDAIGHGPVGILVPVKEKSTVCVVRVTKPQKVDVTVSEPCEGYRLAVDPSGTRLAYGRSDWSFLYFGGKNRSFLGLDHPTGDAVDWSKVKTLEETYVDQLRAMLAAEERRDDLLDEIVEAKGDAELARVLVATIDAPSLPDLEAVRTSGSTIWKRGFDRLKDKTPVLTALSARLGDLSFKDTAATDAVARAVLYGDVDAYDGKSLATAPLDSSSNAARYSLAVLLARLVRTEPTRAATFACRMLEKQVPKGEELFDMSRADLAVALAVVGRAKAKCAVVDRYDEAWDRDYPDACTDDAWKGTQEPVLDQDLATVRRLQISTEESMVAAVNANGLRANRKLQLARQTYTLDVPENPPAVFEAKKGDRIEPDLSAEVRNLRCALTAEKTEGDYVIHFDDAHKRYWYTRS